MVSASSIGSVTRPKAFVRSFLGACTQRPARRDDASRPVRDEGPAPRPDDEPARRAARGADAA